VNNICHACDEKIGKSEVKILIVGVNDMKYMIVALLLIGLLVGCSSIRFSGQPYHGYDCRKSLMHYYSYCSAEKLAKEDFEAKVQHCEKELTTKVCDKEQADILWCMGRVLPGTYTSGGGVGVAVSKGVVISGGQSSTMEGCDCSIYTGALKECRMKKGIFDK
jgi:hypothetical protein